MDALTAWNGAREISWKRFATEGGIEIKARCPIAHARLARQRAVVVAVAAIGIDVVAWAVVVLPRAVGAALARKRKVRTAADIRRRTRRCATAALTNPVRARVWHDQTPSFCHVRQRHIAF